jgi:hypothetical protein
MDSCDRVGIVIDLDVVRSRVRIFKIDIRDICQVTRPDRIVLDDEASTGNFR